MIVAESRAGNCSNRIRVTKGEFAADGSIRLIEWVEKQTPKARLVRRKGRTFLESAKP